MLCLRMTARPISKNRSHFISFNYSLVQLIQRVRQSISVGNMRRMLVYPEDTHTDLNMTKTDSWEGDQGKDKVSY